MNASATEMRRLFSPRACAHVSRPLARRAQKRPRQVDTIVHLPRSRTK